MRSYTESLGDGVATGFALAVALTSFGWMRGTPPAETGGRIFLVGLGVVCIAAIIRVSDAADPPGLVGVFLRRTQGDRVERLGAFRWIDRLVPFDSPWFIAGLTLLASAFYPPFLGL